MRRAVAPDYPDKLLHRAARSGSSGCRRASATCPSTGCLALGVTGPMLRFAGLPWDMRKVEPYLGYETYDFEVPAPRPKADCYAQVPVWAGRRDARVAGRSSSRPWTGWSPAR